MEYKNCEQYVLDELMACKRENELYRENISRLNHTIETLNSEIARLTKFSEIVKSRINLDAVKLEDRISMTSIYSWGVDSDDFAFTSQFLGVVNEDDSNSGRS